MSAIRVAAARRSERETLRAIRLPVFAQEQQVPEAPEWIKLDADAWHRLAYAAQHHPLGCGRLATRREIGRIAVLAEGRSQGVGQALPQQLVELARAPGWPTVSLDAQLPALGCYEHAGLRAEDERFDDAGIAHHSMWSALADRSEAARDRNR